jgi:Family of unknown function (DUF5825)
MTELLLAPPAADAALPGLAVEAWRDHRSRLLPGSSFGALRLSAPLTASVPNLYRSGARCVRLTEPVRLCADARACDVDALIAVRELTALGAAVRWTATCEDECIESRTIFHLFPPARVAGTRPGTVRKWQEQYLPCMCVYRRGPGFIEVRDRRRGVLEILTVDEPEVLAVLDALRDGAPAEAVPTAVRGLLDEAGLAAERAGRIWWLPTPLRRWPNPSMMV